MLMSLILMSLRPFNMLNSILKNKTAHQKLLIRTSKHLSSEFLFSAQPQGMVGSVDRLGVRVFSRCVHIRIYNTSVWAANKSIPAPNDSGRQENARNSLHGFVVTKYLDRTIFVAATLLGRDERVLTTKRSRC